MPSIGTPAAAPTGTPALQVAPLGPLTTMAPTSYMASVLNTCSLTGSELSVSGSGMISTLTLMCFPSVQCSSSNLGGLIKLVKEGSGGYVRSIIGMSRVADRPKNSCGASDGRGRLAHCLWLESQNVDC